MNIKKASQKNKIILGSSVAAIVIVCTIGYLLFASRHSAPVTPVENGTTSATDESSGLTQEQEDAKEAYVDSITDSEKSPTNNGSGGTSSGSSSANLSISAKQNDATVVVSTQITIIGDGTCTLSVASGSKTFAATADVIYQASYSTCAGFSVPTSELGPGTWKITVSAKSLDGAVAQDSVTLEVT